MQWLSRLTITSLVFSLFKNTHTDANTLHHKELNTSQRPYVFLLILCSRAQNTDWFCSLPSLWGDCRALSLQLVGSLKHHGCWGILLVANECITLCELSTSEGDKIFKFPIYHTSSTHVLKKHLHVYTFRQTQLLLRCSRDAGKLAYPVLEVVQYILLFLCEHRGGEDKVFLQTVDEWGWKLLIDCLLLCYHNQSVGVGGRGETSEGVRPVRG